MQAAVFIQGADIALFAKDIVSARSNLHSAKHVLDLGAEFTIPNERKMVQRQILKGRLMYLYALEALMKGDLGESEEYLVASQQCAASIPGELSYCSTVFGKTHLRADLVYYILCRGGESAATDALEFAKTVKQDKLRTIRHAQFLTDCSLAWELCNRPDKERECLHLASSLIPNFKKQE